MNTYQDIIRFWFEELEPKQYWQKDPEFDRMIGERFGETHRQASQCELSEWRASAQGRLAEIIVLDQFSRNMFRDAAQAFAYDAQALVLAQEAIAQGADNELTNEQCSFLYMPYMHSESMKVHEEAVKLFAGKGLQFNLDFEIKHKVIIKRFGRYPHRNTILGRQSTPEELEFLKQPGSGF